MFAQIGGWFGEWRSDCVPYLGTRHLRTPNLDRLCPAGLQFKFYADMFVKGSVLCDGPQRA